MQVDCIHEALSSRLDWVLLLPLPTSFTAVLVLFLFESSAEQRCSALANRDGKQPLCGGSAALIPVSMHLPHYTFPSWILNSAFLALSDPQLPVVDDSGRLSRLKRMGDGSQRLHQPHFPLGFWWVDTSWWWVDSSSAQQSPCDTGWKTAEPGAPPWSFNLWRLWGCLLLPSEGFIQDPGQSSSNVRKEPAGTEGWAPLSLSVSESEAPGVSLFLWIEWSLCHPGRSQCETALENSSVYVAKWSFVNNLPQQSPLFWLLPFQHKVSAKMKKTSTT